MADREHEYEISYNTGSKEVTHVWWDGKRVACDNPTFHENLKGENAAGLTIEDGIEFLKALPIRYNNGYVSCSRVKS